MAVTDLRISFGDARNQGSRPTCVAFAISDAHAAARGRYVPLSPEHLYWHAVQRTPGGRPEDGVTLPTALDALFQDGQCAELGWPYADPLPSPWAPPVTASPIYRRASTTATAAIASITDSLEKASRAVVVTFLVSERFYDPPNGTVTPGTSDVDVAQHAVVAVGHGTEGADLYLLVRNSWGDSWGLDGYAWVRSDYLAPRLSGIALVL